MPLDVVAEVISNVHLSSDYNVLGLAAPEIAERALPGQFVMVKAGDRLEPLLRRPFSVFEVLERTRHDRRPLAAQQAHRTVDRRCSTMRSRAIVSSASDRSDGRSRLSPRPMRHGSSRAASASRRSPRSRTSLRARNIKVTLYYGARRAAELFYLDMFEKMGVELVLATEDGSRGERHRGREGC